MTILLLSGSPSLPSRSSRLLHFVGERLKQRGHRTKAIHIRDLPAQALLHAEFDHPEIRTATQLIADAEAIVIATPIYKAAYSGMLKTFLDLLPQDGLTGKWVLPIATAGSQSHFLALDYALRPILSALAAHQILPSIFATDAQVKWSEQQGVQIDDNILLRLELGIEQLSDSLPAPRLITPTHPVTTALTTATTAQNHRASHASHEVC
ncbi:MAG: NADPH-dependent FMN reductase [Burkholderiaceae bacterium]|nr:NADPH-dependent FMN reductase [Burkholderiaceae bacterium]